MNLKFLIRVLFVVSYIFYGASVLAQTFKVNSTLDTLDINPGDGVCADTSGKCTLRAAIQESNSLSDADTIILGAATYTLTIPKISGSSDADGDLDIVYGLTLQGKGSEVSIIDGNQLDRIFNISTSKVLINAVTIRNGLANGAYGGGIIVQGSGGLEISDCIISDNNSAYGGGIYLGFGSQVQISRCVISDNKADSNGGGLYNFSLGTLAITDSTISNNWGPQGGGGIFHAFKSDTTITNSTISDNRGGYGGGILSQWGSGIVRLTNSTISGNRSAYEGAGISGIGSFEIMNTTITNNSVGKSGRGGGVVINGFMTLRNSIIAGNIDPGGSAPDCIGAIQSQGFNLIGQNTGCSFNATTGDIVGSISNPVDPLLQPLASNGGLTFTHALSPLSPAIDRGNPATPGSGNYACEFTDQRGINRSSGGVCDIGAYELTGGADLWVTLSNLSDSTTPGTLVTQLVQLGNTGPNAALSVSLQITLPEGSENQSVIDESWQCITETDIIDCTQPLLDPFVQNEVTIQFISPDNDENLLTIVSINTSSYDPVSLNNQSQIQIQNTSEPTDEAGGSSLNDRDTDTPFTSVENDIQDSSNSVPSDSESYDSLLDRIRWELAWMQVKDEKEDGTMSELNNEDTQAISNWFSYASSKYQQQWLNEENIKTEASGLKKNILIFSTGTVMIAGFAHLYLRAFSFFGIFFSSPLLLPFNPAPVVLINKKERLRREKETKEELRVENTNKHVGKLLDENQQNDFYEDDST